MKAKKSQSRPEENYNSNQAQRFNSPLLTFHSIQILVDVQCQGTLGGQVF